MRSCCARELLARATCRRARAPRAGPPPMRAGEWAICPAGLWAASLLTLHIVGYPPTSRCSTPFDQLQQTPGAGVMNDTDWVDARVSDDPVLPSTANLSACVALCEARSDCVAVSWSGPGSAPVSPMLLCYGCSRVRASACQLYYVIRAAV